MFRRYCEPPGSGHTTLSPAAGGWFAALVARGRAILDGVATLRVEVSPAVLAWAQRRSGADRGRLQARFPKLEDWEAARSSPTFKQLEDFASATRTPLGAFFLDEPPVDELPLPDFRTPGQQPLDDPSADLIDAIGICERRQEWYLEYGRRIGLERLDFVGSLSLQVEPEAAAAAIAKQLSFEPRSRRSGTWEDALRGLVEHAERAGILVMISGTVGYNNNRILDPAEFRGFAIVDRRAPLIFVNGTDSKSAQNFTIAHELAHIWLGESGVSNVGPRTRDLLPVERWCNRVAAELLVPTELFVDDFDPDADPLTEAHRVARIYKVSPAVALRRARETNLITWDEFETALAAEERAERTRKARRPSGGDFYNTLNVKVSKTFARAVVSDAAEGRTLYRDAFRLLGLTKAKTFDRLREELGVS